MLHGLEKFPSWAEAAGIPCKLLVSMFPSLNFLEIIQILNVTYVSRPAVVEVLRSEVN